VTQNGHHFFSSQFNDCEAGQMKEDTNVFWIVLQKAKEETKVLGLLNEKSEMTESYIKMVQSTFGLVDNSLSDTFR
jgi:hypothetical protein